MRVTGVSIALTATMALLTNALSTIAAAPGPAVGTGEITLLDRTLECDPATLDGRFRSLTHQTGQWYGSTFWSGPGWTRVGRDWQHPGERTPSVRRFRCPHDGRVAVMGRVRKLHLAGDGVVARILHNQREVWRAELEGNDGEGKEHRLELQVREGDSIRFEVNQRGGIACDTTGWDPTVSDPGREERSPASAAFAATQQGAGNWFYEMDTAPAEAQQFGGPRLRVFAPDLVLLTRPIGRAEPITLSSDQCLPVAVISRGDQEGGLVLAFDRSGPWSIAVEPIDASRSRVVVRAAQAEAGGSRPFVAEYRGGWGNGLIALERALEGGAAPPSLSARVRPRLERAGLTSLALWAFVQEEWLREDRIPGSAEQAPGAGPCLHAARDHLARLREAIRTMCNKSQADAPAPERFAPELDRLLAAADASQPTPERARALWIDVRCLKRRILLADPLLDLHQLLVCERAMPSWSHLVAQYFGWRQRPGGGLIVLEEPGRSLRARPLTEGRLPAGSILEPRLSPDASRVLFAHVACGNDVPDPASLPVNEEGGQERYFHLYEIGIGGSGLRQLTEGPYDDLMGEYLPGGDLVFCSTRRRGYARCFGPEYSYRWHTYTLHRMHPDGSGIHALSHNDVSEWFPSVRSTGEILFARWDYIDRDAVTHQNLWSMRPDGTGTRAVWGNATPKPHCTFQARSIPGSDRLVFVASAHHSITGGPLCLLDPATDPNDARALTRLTPQPFPEADGVPEEWYEAPWPLSEQLFLVGYSPHRLRFQGEHMRDPNPDAGLRVCLLDARGNRELLYRNPDLSATTPTPVRPRIAPPQIADGETRQEHAPLPAELARVLVTNVYDGLGDAPRGTVRELRVVQIFPKSTWLANQPRIGVAGEENGRAILGTVPVEADGSAHFTVPVGVPLLFQALDRNGMAYQTMRSSVEAHRGELLSCIGCHEHPMHTPTTDAASPLAARRAPTPIAPGELGGRPFGFVEMIQPILDRHCVRCHGGEQRLAGLDLSRTPEGEETRSYRALCGRPEDWKSTTLDPALVDAHLLPRFVQRNQIQQTPPGGAYGARGSRLLRLLRSEGGHQGARLTEGEIRRLAAWIDLNLIFYGVYDTQARTAQLRGEPVPMPPLQ